MQNIGAINKDCKKTALQFAIILQYYCAIFYIAINIGAKGIIAIFCNNIGPTPVNDYSGKIIFLFFSKCLSHIFQEVGEVVVSKTGIIRFSHWSSAP